MYSKIWYWAYHSIDRIRVFILNFIFDEVNLYRIFCLSNTLKFIEKITIVVNYRNTGLILLVPSTIIGIIVFRNE